MKIYCTKNYTQQRLKNKVDKIKPINKSQLFDEKYQNEKKLVMLFEIILTNHGIL